MIVETLTLKFKVSDLSFSEGRDLKDDFKHIIEGYIFPQGKFINVHVDTLEYRDLNYMLIITIPIKFEDSLPRYTILDILKKASEEVSRELTNYFKSLGVISEKA